MSTVLIVDDEVDLRKAAQAALRMACYEVREADSAAAALNEIEKRPPDLILCDLNLGIDSGLDVLKQLRENPETAILPLILITASDDETVMRRSMELGADDFLRKPFSAEELVAAVNARLKKQQQIEAELRVSEARFRTLFRSMTEGVALHEIVHDSNGMPVDYRILDVNPGFEKHTGIPVSRARGRLATEVYGTAVSPYLDVFETVARTGTSASFETRFTPLQRDFQVSICQLSSGQFATIFTDVTRRKEAEAELIENSRVAGFAAEIGKALTQNLPLDVRLQECSELMVQHLDAVFARIWILNPATRILELQASAGLYTHLNGPHSRIELGNLKIGWIAESKQPYLSNDVFQDTRTSNRDWAAREKIVAFAGHPLLLGDEVMGVMGLFARKPLPNSIRQRLGSIAKSIAASIYRHRAEEQQRLMEIQLRQAQKLESIGQLAAGIAHEINSPMQYIGDNTRFLQDAFNDLHRILGTLRSFADGVRAEPGTGDARIALEAILESTDVNFLLDEIPRAIDQNLQGVERVIKIVRAMKEFSHPGVEQKVVADLNHAIESTITVARNEWKYVADLETDFDPALPLVPCLPGEFNQVILNLIINAAHAIADVVGPQPIQKGKITIRTRRRGESVEICVEDTGTGIPVKVRNRIFDPFFTTKPVGKGSGQGLAIARSVVVDKHGGTLTFETEPGRGTKFIILLPIIPIEAGEPVPASA